jgi:hypothetical protein
MERFSRMLDGVGSMNEVKNLLGTPSTMYRNVADIRVQYTYTNLSPTVQIIVQEKKDGRITFAFGGKAIKSSESENVTGMGAESSKGPVK